MHSLFFGDRMRVVSRRIDRDARAVLPCRAVGRRAEAHVAQAVLAERATRQQRARLHVEHVVDHHVVDGQAEAALPGAAHERLRLAELGHWRGVEARNHNRRDVSLNEDRIRSKNVNICASPALLCGSALFMCASAAPHNAESAREQARKVENGVHSPTRDHGNVKNSPHPDAYRAVIAPFTAGASERGVRRELKEEAVDDLEPLRTQA